MITTCPKCGCLYDAGSEEQAYEIDRSCRRCFDENRRIAAAYAEARDRTSSQPPAPTQPAPANVTYYESSRGKPVGGES